MNKKSIFLYDFLQVKGGAEALSMTLIEAIDALDFCVAFSDQNIFSASERRRLKLIELASYTGIVGWQSIKAIRAFRQKAQFISQYKQVIYSGVYAPAAVRHHPQGRNLYYCHTPPRFVYDLQDYYLQQALWWQKPLLKLLARYVKYHYEQSIAQMDLIIANSKNVQQRIAHYLGKESLVIHPPIAVERFNWIAQGDYYLSSARIEPYKRVELIVRSFMAMPDKKLVVASGGSDLLRLKNLAADYHNIEFTGWCSEQQLQELTGRCIATIYIPPDEDFGMSPVESMAAGKPVIAVAEGGLLETIVHQQTGLLIQPQPDENTLIEAVQQLDAETALQMRAHCQQRAQLFRTEVFIDKMQAVLAEY